MAGPHDYSKRRATQFQLTLNQRGRISRTASLVIAAFAFAAMAAVLLNAPGTGLQKAAFAGAASQR